MLQHVMRVSLIMIVAVTDGSLVKIPDIVARCIPIFGKEHAAELGLFGAPSFRVGEELFWGNDRLADALDWATQPAGSA